ncbi:hypothetical protein FGADI_2657 [Fusarium gaditjirri]|uniref:Uncharacterized protein n=1 Tax=Fusarium gaditjirri TaxID=282569 RepID=A0A8H4X1X7_9HYPO|nr:hypothetical protein FGADI_2657 [Fusarium gaditjirri]
MVNLQLISAEHQVDKVMAKIPALSRSQPISPQQITSTLRYLKQRLTRQRLFHNRDNKNPASRARTRVPRIREAEGSFVTSLQLPLPVETHNLLKGMDLIMGLCREVECMSNQQPQVEE